MDIGFVGLGTMGRGMVRNLLAAGHSVTIWNRSQKTLPPELSAAGLAPTIAAAITGKSRVFVCVTGPAAQRDIYFGEAGIIAHVAKGAIVADATTTDPEVAREIAAAVEVAGASYLDAPVFGSKGEAWEGRLDIVVGGTAAAFEAMKPLFEPLAATIHYMGVSGNGAIMKLVGNLLVAAQMESIGEALSIALKAGLEGKDVVGVFDVADYSSILVRNVSRATLARDFAPSFYLKHMLKDARLIGGFAQKLGVPLPVATTIGELYQAALAQGYGELNASALHKLQFALSGIKD